MHDLKLWSFFLDCGRMGYLEGLFIASESELSPIIGKDIYFGEVLGKHSEIFCEASWDNIKLVSDDTDFINKLMDIVTDGYRTVSGYSPLDYFDDEDYE